MKRITIIILLCSIFCCKNSEVKELRNIGNQDFDTIGNSDNETQLFELLSPDQTKIDFKNMLPESQDFNFKTYAYIYNGAGIAVGDINNDGLPDLYMGGNLVVSKMYLNMGNFTFKDITKESGLENLTSFRTGVSMVDINTDGFLDIYVCTGGLFEDVSRKNLLYINNGNSTFTEKAEEYGIADMSYSTQAYFFDMENDGDVDMYLLNHPPSPKESNNLRLENDKDGKQRIALSADLRFISDRLYRNDGGKFKDVTEDSGILNDAFGLSANIGDFNDDNLPDIYVCNDYVKPDYLYINNGDGTFTDQFNSYFQHTSFSSMGSDFSDINNDGCPDLMTLDMFPEDNYRQKMHGTEYNYDKYLLTKKLNLSTQFIKNTLQINNCNGTFSDIAMMSNVAHTDWSWATLFADYDNDGWKDIFVTNGYRRSVSDNDYVRYTQDSLFKNTPKTSLTIEKILATIPEHKTTSYLYKNNGNLSFTNVSEKWNSGPPEFSNGAVYVDLNNDGYLDLITNNLDEAPFIFKNTGAESRKNNFIRFSLHNEKGKTSLGTKVEVTDDKGNIQTQFFFQARGFLSSVEPILHFGLGKSSNISQVKVTWPNGTQQLVKDFKINSISIVNYDNSGTKAARLVNPDLYFEDITKSSGLDLKHTENEYIDFKREPLLHRKYSEEGPTTAVGDVNGDGLDDIYIGGSVDVAGSLNIQNKKGKFEAKAIPDFIKDKKCEDGAALFLDVNGDKSLDLIVVSGGTEYIINSPDYQGRLYINDGKGNFVKKEGGMPNIMTSSSTISAHDIDKDGDLDIFVGGRISPGQYPTAPISYIAKNDNGKFVNATPELSDGIFRFGMVTSSVFEDLDKDGVKELIISGEWTPISIFAFRNGKYTDVTSEWGLENYTGWWESLHVKDMNGDGFPEIIAGNAGLNTHMKASEDKPITLHYKDYDNNGTIDPLICYFNGSKSYPVVMRDRLLDHMIILKKKFLRYKDYAGVTISEIFSKEQRTGEKVLSANTMSSMIFYNEGGKKFSAKSLPNLAQISMIRSIIDIDINKDGFPDLVTGGNFFGTEVLLGRYDASIGNLLMNDSKGNLKNVPSALSGLNIGGDVRHIAQVKSKDAIRILVTRNNDSVSLLKLKDSTVN